jgi:effector-binding domain-containing protein
MIYVNRMAKTTPGEIAKTMGGAFAILAEFLHTNRVTPAGAPIAVFHLDDNGNCSIDVGFPVLERPRAVDTGDVKFGSTPGGSAVKAIHRGPYQTISETYREIGAHMRTNHLPMPTTSWEVYRNDPQTTPAQDLVTEVYFPVAAGPRYLR